MRARAHRPGRPWRTRFDGDATGREAPLPLCRFRAASRTSRPAPSLVMPAVELVGPREKGHPRSSAAPYTLVVAHFPRIGREELPTVMVTTSPRPRHTRLEQRKAPF
jgi:hypothetical protein